MKININFNIEKKYFFLIAGVLILLVGIIVVSSADYSIFGHRVGEIDFTGNLDVGGDVNVGGKVMVGGVVTNLDTYNTLATKSFVDQRLVELIDEKILQSTPIYQITDSRCVSQNEITFNQDCFTIQCDSFLHPNYQYPLPLYYDCAGDCSARSPQECPWNTLIGYATNP